MATVSRGGTARLPYRVRRNGWCRDPPRAGSVRFRRRVARGGHRRGRPAGRPSSPRRTAWPRWPDVDGLLGVGVDAVYVCVPPFAHGDAGAAGRAGRGGAVRREAAGRRPRRRPRRSAAQLTAGRGAHPGGPPLALRRTGRPGPGAAGRTAGAAGHRLVAGQGAAGVVVDRPRHDPAVPLVEQACTCSTWRGCSSARWTRCTPAPRGRTPIRRHPETSTPRPPPCCASPAAPSAR